MERGHGGGAHSRTSVFQSTNDDAATSKLWCVNKGYIKEDHVHFFVRRQIRYARWAALRTKAHTLHLTGVRGSLFRVER